MFPSVHSSALFGSLAPKEGFSEKKYVKQLTYLNNFISAKNTVKVFHF